VRHGLHSTTNSDADISSFDTVGNSSNGLEAGRAHSVNSVARGSLGDASHEHSHSHLSGSTSRGKHVSDDNFVNLSSGDLGLLDGVSKDNLKHSLEGSVSLGSLLGLSAGGSGHADDAYVVSSLGSDLAAIVVRS